MTTKKDARGNLRLPPALHKELLHYTVDEDITLAEAVERAWTAFKAVPVHVTFPKSEHSGISSSLEAKHRDILHMFDSALSDMERECLGKALRILRSKTQLVKSLSENLDGFCIGLDAMEEVLQLREALSERQGHPDAPSPSDDIQAGIKRIGRHAEAARRGLEGAAKPRKAVQKKQG